MDKAMTAQERKRDTREKIILGDLIVEAGLRSETRVLLLGALIDIRRRLENEAGERNRLLIIGGAMAGDAVP